MFNTFGKGAVQTAYVNYLELDIRTNDITLVWPDAYVNVPYTDPITDIHYNSAAARMKVITSAAAHTITLPDATKTSVGQNFIITNSGPDPFNLLKSGGSVLATIDPGISLYFSLDANTLPALPAPLPDPAGTWIIVTFGAGTSEAIAAELAGYGLIAILNTLNTDIPVINYTIPPVIDETFRAKLIVWTGGVTTLNLPVIGDAPGGYYVSFTNQSTGPTITIIPGELGTKISGKLSVEVQLGQSLTIISDGVNWWTLGFGQNQLNTTTVNLKPVGGSSDIILTSEESSSLIQNFTGTLTGNITVFFPITPDSWIISNNTNPSAFTLRIQLIGPTGTSYIIPQGTTQSFGSDSNTMVPAQTSLQILNNGSLTIPSVSFGVLTSSYSGFYYDADDLGTLYTVNSGSELLILSQDIDNTYYTIRSPYNNFAFTVTVNAGTGVSLKYNSINFLSVDATGNVILPAAPLSIESGGTNAVTQPAALNNLMPILPAVPAAGTIIYYDGADWKNLAPGTIGQFLKMTSATTIGWVTYP